MMFNRKEYRRNSYIKNKELEMANHKKWVENNSEIWKRYYDKYNKQYYQINIEKFKEHNKRYYRENRKEILKHQKKYQQDNKDKIKKRNNEYYKTEEGKASHQKANFKRKTKSKNVINTLTAKGWADILEEHNYICIYCGVEFDCENLPTKDHVIPISKGGHNTKENVVPACRSCNSSKYDKILLKGEK